MPQPYPEQAMENNPKFGDTRLTAVN